MQTGVLNKLIDVLSRPQIFFYALIAMMIILVIGTVAQKYIGLYLAQRIFFDSYIVWFGIVPFLGMRSLMLVIALNLLVKLIFKSPWSKTQAGSVMTHIGVFILLLGAGITGLFSEEGNILIAEGQQNNIVSDYHVREWVFFIEDSHGSRQILRESLSYDDVNVGDLVQGKGIDAFSIEVKEKYANSELIETEGTFSIKEVEKFKEDEANRWGMTVYFSEVGNKGVSLPLIEGREVSVRSRDDKNRYVFLLRKVERILPFSVHLDEFTKKIHPGTDKPKAYSSRIQVVEQEGKRWNALIEMNKPLRYQGYTLFQSSFVVTDEGEQTVLAVVKNEGRLYPYVASIIICIGILWHIVVRQSKRRV